MKRRWWVAGAMVVLVLAGGGTAADLVLIEDLDVASADDQFLQKVVQARGAIRSTGLVKDPTTAQPEPTAAPLRFRGKTATLERERWKGRDGICAIDPPRFCKGGK